MYAEVYRSGARLFDFQVNEARNEKALSQVNWTGLFLCLMQECCLVECKATLLDDV